MVWLKEGVWRAVSEKRCGSGRRAMIGWLKESDELRAGHFEKSWGWPDF